MGDTTNQQTNKEFQRAYKACIPCRKRKAKCQVIETTGPPCQRCRRELRECIFSEERSWTKKRRKLDDGEDVEDSTGQEENTITYTLDAHGVTRHSTAIDADAGLSISHSHQMDSPFEGSPSRTRAAPVDQASLTKSVMETVMSNSKDALDLLFQAATQQADTPVQTDGYTHEVSDVQTVQYATPSTVLPALVAPQAFSQPCRLSKTEPEVLKVWRACKFVRMGWFTAEEAITYVDLFFEHLHPLSPILSDFYSRHENHRLLLSEDPLLCCTILMISARYNVLTGISGASRAYFIHDRLWDHCQHLITKIMFGQEQGRNAKTRSAGSIEALLLITEWHPKMLHFPSAIDGWDSDLLLADFSSDTTSVATPKAPCEDLASSNKWLSEVIESVRRSDRMSWMLLGNALALAHELGAFDDEKKLANKQATQGSPDDRTITRLIRVRKLLYIYTEQLSSRLGHTSMIPPGLSHSVFGRSAVLNASKSNNEWQSFVNGWMDLTKLVKSVTDMFFPSLEVTKQMLQNGKYVGMLEHFQPLFDQWRTKHLDSSRMSPTLFTILTVEYHFFRIYLNSLGMQAVVERTVSEASQSNSPSEPSIHTTVDPTDYTFIQEVVSGSSAILQHCTTLAYAGRLRFAPVRIFVRIVTSAMYLVKGLSLGVFSTKLHNSLDILDKVIEALKESALDDMHLASRYAVLLELHASRLRSSFKVTARPANIPVSEAGAPFAAIHLDGRNGGDSESADHQGQHGGGTGLTPATDVLEGWNDEWMSLPFNQSMAPFGAGGLQAFPGLDDGTLDFIWNLPT